MQKNIEFAELLADVREQVLYLQELGVDSLDAEFPEKTSSKLIADSPKQEERYVPPEILRSAVSPTKTVGQTSNRSRIASLPSLAKRPETKISGTRVTRVTTGITGEKGSNASEALFEEMGPTLAESGETIEQIRADIGNCTRCPLHEGRTQIVHTTGNFNADLMFVGEAPGADEDEQGFPFVGRAGQLLTKIIEGIGLKREDVCIGNINRCRPPGNRQPLPPETAACRPFLLREIAVVRPKVIVVLGNTATQNLLDIKTPISKLRGNFQDYFGVKVMPTFHPAYLLRDPHKKREVWEDMKKVRDYLNSH